MDDISSVSVYISSGGVFTRVLFVIVDNLHMFELYLDELEDPNPRCTNLKHDPQVKDYVLASAEEIYHA